MRSKTWLPLCLLAASAANAQGAGMPADRELASLVALYKDVHAHPELSHHEERTAQLLAAELKRAGYDVHDHIGRYADGSPAFGVAGVMKNGRGPTLLVRADMDALPITEATGADYASQTAGVMHACGHDVHTTVLIGTARVLAAARPRWHGTLILVGQPSEETIDGAQAMLADGFYEKVGTPDMAVALHDTADHPAGVVSVVSGTALPSSTSIDVLFHGVGGHGAMPQLAKDPIVMASEFVVGVQTIVSRRQDPRDPAVVTVGDFHGGTKRNIIPSEVKLEITGRAFSEHGRQNIIEGVQQTARGVAVAAGLPADLMPQVTVLEHESAPMTYNDPALSARVRAALVGALGKEHVVDEGPGTASEDFNVFSLEGHRIPAVMFGLGAADAGKLAEAQAAGKSLPGPHSPKFQPVAEPTLKTGVTAMSSVVLALLR